MLYICISVFKSIVGRNQEYPAKVKANMRARNKIVIDKFVKYRMANSCECSVLNKGMLPKVSSHIFIFFLQGLRFSKRQNIHDIFSPENLK